ncbi:MAG: transcription antitermination protein NusB [Bacteroidia bacterium]|nr:transcription antitermination protein NusB [Bacteroidia bacterium]
MLSRRLLRVKVMQIVYAHHVQGDSDYKIVLSELQHSVAKAHELYMYLLLLPSALRRMALKKIEIGRQKIRPTKEELNPNTRFVNNRAILELENNETLKAYEEETGISWFNDEELLRTLFNKLLASDLYKEYMESEEDSFENDRRFLFRYITHELATYDLIYDHLESASIYWNDEAQFEMSLAGKTIKLLNAGNGQTLELLGMYKDDEDKEFTETLLRKTMTMYDESFSLIKKFSLKWDPERVSLMDTILIDMAIAEMTSMRELQVKVTLNEYLEISKYYSSEKSHIYINGVLEKIVRQLFEEKRILASQLQ